jgi:hypothetical protein
MLKLFNNPNRSNFLRLSYSQWGYSIWMRKSFVRHSLLNFFTRRCPSFLCGNMQSWKKIKLSKMFESLLRTWSGDKWRSIVSDKLSWLNIRCTKISHLYCGELSDDTTALIRVNFGIDLKWLKISNSDARWMFIYRWIWKFIIYMSI